MMEFSIEEYKEYNNDEILNLYGSVGWTNYTSNPAMLENAYKNLPEYQHQGSGTALIQAILEIYSHVYQKSLMTDSTEKTIGIYKLLGFYMDTDIECRAFMKIF